MRWLRRIVSAILKVLFALVVLAPLGAWATLALWYRLPAPEWARGAAAGVFAAVALVAVIALFTRRRWIALGVFVLAFGATVVWWSTIEPPANGDWAADVERQTTGRLDGDILTLSDVRDFDWRSQKDFTPRWSERSYDLTKLKTLDLFLDYWAGPEMAHLIMSFGFDDGQVLSWSVEIRGQKGDQYSPVADAFKSHTLISIAAPERNSVRLRSNIRHEDLRLYRLRTSPEAARKLLLGYVEEANAMHQTPMFYNSITTNCTTAVARLIRHLGENLPLDWRLLVNGYLPGYLYEHDHVVTSIPLAELMERASIREHAMQADQSPDFSRIIREGVPSPFSETKP